MPYTNEQIIELTAIKVQEIIVPKVEQFTQGVVKEVHQMHLEMKDNKEFNAAVIAQLNDVRAEVAKFEGITKLVTELHTLFCVNGYMQRFNDLAEAVNTFFRMRLETCPVAKDVHDIKVAMSGDRKDASDRLEGSLKTRIADEKEGKRQEILGKRWKLGFAVTLLALVVAVIGGIVAKGLGWW